MNEYNRSANEAVRRFGRLAGAMLTNSEIRDLKQEIHNLHIGVYGKSLQEAIGFGTAIEAQYAFLKAYGISPKEYEKSVSNRTFAQLFHDKREAILNRGYHDPVDFTPEQFIPDTQLAPTKPYQEPILELEPVGID